MTEKLFPSRIDTQKIADALADGRLLIVKDPSGTEIPEDSRDTVIAALRAVSESPASHNDDLIDYVLAAIHIPPGMKGRLLAALSETRPQIVLQTVLDWHHLPSAEFDAKYPDKTHWTSARLMEWAAAEGSK